MQIHYLEIVTRDVNATCEAYQAANRLTFGEPVPELGNARTAELANGGRIGVRLPMSEVEQPLVRPYWLVEDLDQALDAIVVSGAEVAHPPLTLPGHGRFAIYIQSGVQQGLWQL